MTREEKQLLLNDLCARLPYGVIVKENDGVNENDNKLLDIDMFDGCINYDYIIEDIKPYLRPMSSMTEEEKAFLDTTKEIEYTQTGLTGKGVLTLESYDYLNSIHVDYRELIPMGLALEAKEGMYKTE